jgi:hypothetical protein
MMRQILERCAQAFEDDLYTRLFYEAVCQTFENCPENIDKLDVLLKFSVLNDLYRTNIYDKTKIVDHINRLSIEENLDQLLKSGNPDAVNKIRSGHGICLKKTGMEYNFYSFATKYCHFSNPKYYPIYDQYVEKAIMKLRNENYIQFSNQNDLYNPQTFKNIICLIIQKFDLKDYQTADRALWRYGQHLAKIWTLPELLI